MGIFNKLLRHRKEEVIIPSPNDLKSIESIDEKAAQKLVSVISQALRAGDFEGKLETGIHIKKRVEGIPSEITEELVEEIVEKRFIEAGWAKVKVEINLALGGENIKVELAKCI